LGVVVVTCVTAHAFTEVNTPRGGGRRLTGLTKGALVIIASGQADAELGVTKVTIHTLTRALHTAVACKAHAQFITEVVALVFINGAITIIVDSITTLWVEGATATTGVCEPLINATIAVIVDAIAKIITR
jgi:hypothetical protein